jgi:hypothetical protein
MDEGRLRRQEGWRKKAGFAGKKAKAGQMEIQTLIILAHAVRRRGSTFYFLMGPRIRKGDERA